MEQETGNMHGAGRSRKVWKYTWSRKGRKEQEGLEIYMKQEGNRRVSGREKE